MRAEAEAAATARQAAHSAESRAAAAEARVAELQAQLTAARQEVDIARQDTARLTAARKNALERVQVTKQPAYGRAHVVQLRS